ncbi:MAG: DUF748 domain-containing protein [Syntrophales bacterium]
MNLLKKILAIAVLLIVLFTLAGYFIVPPVLKFVLVKKLSENLHRDVAIGGIKFNPFTLGLSIKDFSIKDRNGTEPFVSFQELFVNLESMSIVKKAVILQEVKLVQSYFRIVRNKDLTYNFSDILKANKPEEGNKEGAPLQFSVNNIRIINGKVDFLDGPKETQHTARDINIGIPFISNMAYSIDTFVNPSLSTNINGTSYVLQGRTKPFTTNRETEVEVNIKDLNIPYYLSYVPMKMNFRLPSAYLNIHAKLSFRQEKKGPPALILTGNTTLKDVVANDLQNKAIFKFQLMSVDMASVKPFAGEIHLSRLFVNAPEVTVCRNDRGEINLLGLVPAQGDNQNKSAKPQEQMQQGNKTIVDIDEILLDKGQFIFHDNRPSEPLHLTLSDISLRAEHISTAAGKEGRASLSLSLPRKGTIALDGPVQITPVSAKLALHVKDLYIPVFQPYVGDVVNMQITGGRVTANGNLSVGLSEKGLKTRYTGKILLSRFASIDSVQASDLIKWGSLYLNGVDAGFAPLSLRIGGVALSDFYTRVQINPDGTLNLQNLAASKVGKETAEKRQVVQDKKTESQGSSQTKKSESNIRIGAVTLQGGEVDFIDRFIKPNFTGKLVEVGGRISSLSSKADTRADVELRGKLDGYAPLEITGKINPLQKDLFVDLKAAFKDMDLSPVTPYSGKYIGYTIQKGKLSFDLKYLIAQRKLDSQNNVFIDQLTLGEKVESPQATKLPVSLAIALLKDRNGRIKLDMPVSGTLDDPKFSVWKIIIQVLMNILTKAATAPFALLGSLVSGGEELSYVEFDPGNAMIS